MRGFSFLANWPFLFVYFSFVKPINDPIRSVVGKSFLNMLGLTDNQLTTVMGMARTLPVEKRDL